MSGSLYIASGRESDVINLILPGCAILGVVEFGAIEPRIGRAFGRGGE
jgi:hypothetical protein